MTRRLVATYVVLAAIVLAVLEVPLAIVQRSSQHHDLQQRVERDAVALAALVEDDLQGERPGSVGRVRDTVAAYGRSTGVRVVVVNARGLLEADSSVARPLGRDFSTRPEVSAALAGRVATGQRRSDTLGADLLYVAVPVASGGRVFGAVRATVPTSRVDAQARRYRLALGAIAAGVLAATALVGWWLARWVGSPLLDLRGSARRVAAGDLGERADASEGPPEVRELAAAFNDMVARLQRTVGTQEQFVADASHQLRSPLTALRLRIENLQYDLPEDARNEADGALAEVDRLARLVNGLLALARADRRARRAAARDVAAITAERTAVWRPVAEEQGVALDADVTPGLRALASDDALEQIIDNLVANALEASRPGTRVTIRAAGGPGDAVTLTVADEGRGMSDEARAHAFDRFWTDRRDRGGSGLGLAIVKRMVEADGGTVRLDAGPGGGIVALVRLPAAP
ncbi:MAG: HAMP domain-containing protein [Thermoleophilia bacterium]|nr:HAMP domain-containing protein [Thermoleophilia bacterium]